MTYAMGWDSLPSAPTVNAMPAFGGLADTLGATQLRSGPVNFGNAVSTTDANQGMMNTLAQGKLWEQELAAQKQKLGEAEQQYQQDQKQPGVMDFIGLGLGAANGVHSLDQKNQLMDLLKNIGSGSTDLSNPIDWLG